jgi:GTPase Era involved in 16S rRNA processing
MTSEGFAAARQRSERIADALDEIAALIGAPANGAADGLGMISEAAALRHRAQDARRGIFKLLVLGRFKNGKSTLLNAMLGDRVLPTGALPATAVITVLVHGETDDVAVFQTGREQPLLLSADEFRQRFKLAPEDQETLHRNRVADRFRDVEYAQIACQHRFCANGVRLVDSPGLGEAVSRARVATNFLRQAHAVVFVLDATAILGQEEKQFIETQLAPLMQTAQNVFFVVNRFDLVGGPDAADLRRWVESSLAPHFSAEAGAPDPELVQRRIFFVSARAALKARLQTPVDVSALEASGLPRLEQEIERFLTGQERLRAELGAPCQAAAQVVAEAGRRVARAKTALAAPLRELERRREETERRLTGLEEQRRHTEQTVLRFGEIVGRRVYADLVTYIEEMKSSWSRDAGLSGGGDRLVNLDAITGEELLRAVASSTRDAQRKRILDVLQEQLDGYLRVKFEQWGARVADVIQPDMDLMVEEIRRQVEDFAVELDRIEELFAAGEVTSDAGRVLSGLGRDHGARTVLDLMALMLEDLGRTAGGQFGTGEWGSFVRWLIGHALLGWAVVMLLGMFALPFVLAAEFFMVQHPTEKLKQIILKKTSEQVHADLQQAIPARREEIRARIDAQFQQIAASVARVLHARIDEARREQDRIIGQKQRERFSIEQEQRRLDTVQSRLAHLLDVIRSEANGDSRTGAEIGPIAVPSSARDIQP